MANINSANTQRLQITTKDTPAEKQMLSTKFFEKYTSHHALHSSPTFTQPHENPLHLQYGNEELVIRAARVSFQIKEAIRFVNQIAQRKSKD